MRGVAAAWLLAPSISSIIFLAEPIAWWPMASLAAASARCISSDSSAIAFSRFLVARSSCSRLEVITAIPAERKFTGLEAAAQAQADFSSPLAPLDPSAAARTDCCIAAPSAVCTATCAAAWAAAHSRALTSANALFSEVPRARGVARGSSVLVCIASTDGAATGATGAAAALELQS
jgi:hypothetical protein